MFVNKTASIKPINGDMTMNSNVLLIPENTNADGPALTKAAPISPPISAWEELEGIPFHQVIMPQTTAPINALAIIVLSITVGITIPLPTVVAT